MTSEEEQIKQKRREKILARTKDEVQFSTESKPKQEEQTSEREDVFKRYKNLKGKEQSKIYIQDVSKYAGVFLALMNSVGWSSSTAFPLSLLILLSWGFYTNHTSSSTDHTTLTKSDDDLLISKLGSVVDKLGYIDKAVYLLKIALNLLFSYLVIIVLVNSFKALAFTQNEMIIDVNEPQL